MKFEVYKDGRVDNDFVIRGASLFGVDRIPFRNSKYISFRNGVIECRPRGSEPAGLSLLWPVKGFGNVLLYTTRLMEQAQPYILNVELARAKLMEVVIKREDWSIFEDSKEVSELFDEAKGLLVETLNNINNRLKASVLADKCLGKALFLSEKMALNYAEFLFNTRLKNRGFARSSLGCRIDSDQLAGKNYQKLCSDIFAHISIPVNWAEIEKVKGEYDFSVLDKCLKVFGQKRLLISAGSLLRFEPGFLPEWLMKGETDFEDIRQSCYDFVSKVVTRYARYVHIWQVIGGLNAYNHFRFNFERVLEITRTSCLAAREADNKSLKMIEILCPWGEYYANDLDTIPPLVYVDMITQAGINFDAIGLQVVFGSDQAGIHIRDMMQISSLLDKFMTVPKPLHITSFSVPDRSNAEPGSGSVESVGMWREPWSQELQSKWINRFCRVAFSKPYVNTLTYSRLADKPDCEINGCGLLNEKYQPKKAYMEIVRIQKQILQGK